MRSLYMGMSYPEAQVIHFPKFENWESESDEAITLVDISERGIIP
jgi:hypothetical protein